MVLPIVVFFSLIGLNQRQRSLMRECVCLVVLNYMFSFQIGGLMACWEEDDMFLIVCFSTSFLKATKDDENSKPTLWCDMMNAYRNTIYVKELRWFCFVFFFFHLLCIFWWEEKQWKGEKIVLGVGSERISSTIW